MGRATVIRGVTFPGRIGWEGRFFALLAAAARGETDAETEHALDEITDGRAPVLASDSTMTAWTWITLRNLYAYARAGALYLRRCRACDRRFLTTSRARKNCSERCSGRHRQKRHRAQEQQANRDAKRAVRRRA